MSYTAPAGDAVDFNFSGSYTAPAGDSVDFSFTSSAAVELTITASLPMPLADVQFALDTPELTIAATLPLLSSVIELERGNALTIAATMPAPVAAVTLQWGDDLPKTGVVAGNTADTSGGFGWGKASGSDRAMMLAFNDAPHKQADTQSGWNDAPEQDAEPELPFGLIPPRYIELLSPWGAFSNQTGIEIAATVNYPLPTDLLKQQLWGDFSSLLDRERYQPWNYPPPVDRISEYPHYRVEMWQAKLVWDTRDYTPPARYEVNFDFANSGYMPDPLNLNFSWGAPSPYGNQPIRPTDPGIELPHNVPAVAESEREVVWGDGSWTRPTPDYEIDPGWQIEPDEPAERPPQPVIQEVYIFMPNITLYRTPDGTEFEATDVTWATDADSWGWRFSATLKRDADLALLKPTSSGPREIACEINGHNFTGLVESYGVNRSFGQTGYTIKGRSLSGWLSAPYAPKRSKAITAPYTAQQLAEQELQYTGWTLDWQTEDWLIPAGAYSYENLDPMGAIKRLADTVGAIVQSHPESKTLIVRPRYPVSPHKWTDPATALDAILPVELAQQIGSEYRTLPIYNRAISAGGTVGGVIVTVTRDGTAGDELAPVVTDSLITEQMAGYERGRNEIAKGGSWETMNLITVLTDLGVAPGLMLPGDLVELQDTSETYPVQISSTTIKAESSKDALKVRQQLTAERSISNA